ncbi:MAG: tail fiber domain-containing protein [Flavobacteriales bacterium]|nr:tail fiber domain-containing protein [Flavobacteriales bacterium]
MVDGTGRLHWRRINTWPSSGGGGGTGCEWSLSGGANGNNLWTAVGSGASCPNDDNLVGIGIVSPSAKLHVKYNAVDGQPIVRGGLFQISGDHFSKIAGEFTTIGEGTTHGGVFARASSALSEQWSEGNIAVRAWAVADASGFTHTNRGVQAGADVTVDNQVKNNVGVDVVNNIDYNASVDYNFGIRAKLTTSYGNITDNHAGLFEVWTDCGATQTNYGLKARAAGADINYGIYASASTGLCGTTAWAGYFVGDVQAGATYLPSDAGLKTGIADMEPASAADILALLNVHSYHYNTEAYPQMGLPEGPQVGLLAQELEVQLPGLVKATMHPAELDDDGNVIREAVSYKAVNYTALIPYLVAGYQAQRSANEALAAQLAEQQARMDHLEEALAACCARPVGSDGRMQVGMGEVIEGDARSLSIQPNPFNEQTTLSYTLERSGRAQLLVNSADGKQLKALYEAVQEAGQYQYTWNTGDLVPGVYYVTLLLDGEPLVKKAVKVAR